MRTSNPVDKDEFARLAKQGASIARLSARYGLSMSAVRRIAVELGVKPIGLMEMKRRARRLVEQQNQDS